MVLSDRTIKEEIANGRIVIDPLGDGCVQPASVDLRLDQSVLEFRPERYSYLDIYEDLSGLTQAIDIPDPAPYILHSGQFVLASTMEYVELPDDIVARIEGKSSLGRLGLLIHSTAGYVDPGFKGQLTLEISNVAGVDITLYYGMKIGQISFLRLSTAADNPYGSEKIGSKYQGQRGPIPARFHLEYGKRRRTPRSYPDEPTILKEWLDSSEYAGSIAQFAMALKAGQKTVEDWVYGRYSPNRDNKNRLFEITRLAQYSPSEVSKQYDLFPDKDARLT